MLLTQASFKSSRINAVCGNENQTYLSDTFSD